MKPARVQMMFTSDTCRHCTVHAQIRGGANTQRQVSVCGASALGRIMFARFAARRSLPLAAPAITRELSRQKCIFVAPKVHFSPPFPPPPTHTHKSSWHFWGSRACVWGRKGGGGGGSHKQLRCANIAATFVASKVAGKLKAPNAT